MASGDAYGGNCWRQVEVVTQNAEGTISGNDQSEATQTNDFNIVQGLLSVAFVCIVCGAYYLALMAADRVSVALAPVPLVIIVHALYFAIYTIKECGFTKECCDDLTTQVEAMGFVGNYFKSKPIFLPSACALLEKHTSASLV